MIHSVQFSCSVVSDSLWPHKPQHARPPCPSPTPGVHPNPCPSSQWCHPTISSSVVPLSSCLQSFPASGSFLFFFFRVFSNESALRIRWPKYWSFTFNISPSNEHQDWSILFGPSLFLYCSVKITLTGFLVSTSTVLRSILHKFLFLTYWVLADARV